ncbi:MAG: oxaloacetate decarboxylase subunit alpha, partial [Clostridia bacterium]|nr:oxaloacetate decarboxylase subunit alpha [Clostridia bacterium]
LGERYKMATKEFKGIVKGEYGKTPVEIDPEFVKKIIGDEPRITSRPADALKPELEELRAKIPQGLIEQDEDVLSYALFEQVALKFFEYHKAKKYGLDGENADAALGVHSV